MKQVLFINLLKKLFLIFISIHSIYCCIPGETLEKRQQFDHNNEATLTWLVLIYNTYDDYFALAYGTLIHPKAVLTGGIDLTKKHVKKYLVLKDCDVNPKVDYELFCASRKKVSKISYYHHEYSFMLAVAFLTLESPFDITTTTAPINLINTIDVIDTENCLFTRLMRVVDDKEKSGLIIQPYKTTFHETEFLPENIHPENLKDDRDWIIGERFHQDTVSRNESRVPLNFLGSPLSCPFKNDSQKFGLVGIATFRFLIPYREDDHRPLERFGTFIHILDAYDKIMKMLNENV